MSRKVGYSTVVSDPVIKNLGGRSRSEAKQSLRNRGKDLSMKECLGVTIPEAWKEIVPWVLVVVAVVMGWFWAWWEEKTRRQIYDHRPSERRF